MDTPKKTNEPDYVPSSTGSAIILGHQRAAYERLLAVASASFFVQRETLPVRPRSNTLLVGPSGSGKTFLAGAVAKTLGVPFLSLSAGEWVLIGCSQRGGKTTWPLIVRFLQQNSKSDGVVLFLDEVDKLSGHTSWETFQRAEIFKLLDLGIPEGLCDSDGAAISKNHIDEALNMLANRTYIIGAGAFQGTWEARSKTAIGFSDQTSSNLPMSLADLTATIPRELSNRFRGDVVTLPQLSRHDYRRIVDETAVQVPVYLRETFLRLSYERIEAALQCHQGCRFLEEVMLDTIIAERETIKTWEKPQATPVEPEHPNQSVPDGPGI